MPTPMESETAAGRSLWIRVEGFALLGAASWLYAEHSGNWLFFALAFVAPDLSLIAYAVNARAGEVAYNAAHSYAIASGLAVIGVASPEVPLLPLALAWVAHISFDRVIGLPYPRSVHQANNTVPPLPRMERTIVMVTGASDGIGRATALGLAKLGATISEQLTGVTTEQIDAMSA